MAYRGGFALVPAIPDEVTNVIATPRDGSATVSWQAPAYTGGGTIAYAITVEPGDRFIDGVTSPTTVTGLTNGQAYTFTVTPYTSTETIGLSTTSSPVTPHSVPGAPTGVTGDPGPGQVSVSFTPPAPNDGPAVTGYTVTAQPGNIHVDGTASPITVGGLDERPGLHLHRHGDERHRHVGRLRSFEPGDAAHRARAHRPASSRRPATGRPPSRSRHRPTTAAPRSRKYVVTPSPSGTPVEGTSSPIVVTGLANGQAYTFTVRAVNVAGTGAPSAASSAVTPQPVPGAPTGVTGTPGNGQVSVAFTAPAANGGPAITGYTVTAAAGERPRRRDGKPDHGRRPHERPGLHLHRHRHERDRHLGRRRRPRAR